MSIADLIRSATLRAMPAVKELTERGKKRADPTPRSKATRGANRDPVKTAARLVAAAEARAAKKTKIAHALATGEPLLLEGHDRRLTSKQLTFLKFWAEGESILSACHKAGYVDGGEMGYRMSRDPGCLKVYHEYKSKYEAAGQMTRKRVMDGLLEGIEMAKMMSEPAQVIAGWREVGKMCGYYEPTKHSINVTVNGQVTMKQLEQKSDKELLEMIENVTAEDVQFTEVPNDFND